MKQNMCKCEKGEVMDVVEVRNAIKPDGVPSNGDNGG